MTIQRFKIALLRAALLLTFLFSCTQAHASYRFVVYADCRSPKNDPTIFNHQVLGYITSEVAHLSPRPAFVVFMGDMVNRAVDTTYTHNYLNDWKVFMENLLGDIPLYVAVGNSDLYGNTGWTEYPLQAVYQETFDSLPDNGPIDYKKLAYSFEYGTGKERALFVVMDAFGFYKSHGNWENFDNGFDDEQITWFYDVATSSTAPHKFAFSHGPAFSTEGYPVGASVRPVWDIMLAEAFDLFYCGHEHLFTRWMIDRSVYPEASRNLIQTLLGSAGAPLDPISKVKVDPKKAHAHAVYTYAVVDVDGDTVVQRVYAVIPDGVGGFVTQNLDNVILKK